MEESIHGSTKIVKNLRIVVDTNFLILLFLKPTGYAASVLRSIKEHHTLILSDYILHETVRNIERLSVKYSFSSREIDVWNLYLPNIADVMTVLPENYIEITQPYIRDKKDSGIFMTALLSRADVLISNDRDLLDNGEIKQFLDVIKLNEFEDYVSGSVTLREKRLVEKFLK